MIELTPRQSLGPYRLLRRLGAGGMAEVSLVQAHGASGFERQVALELLLPELREHPHSRRLWLLARWRQGRAAILLTILGLGCGPAAPTPSWRADLGRSRHVLVVRPLSEHPPQVANDGSVLDGSTIAGGKLDVAWCARVCAVAARAGERVVGCFVTGDVPDDLARRLRAHGELLDCAMGPPPRPTSNDLATDPQVSH